MNIDQNTAAWIETVALGLVAAFLFQSTLLLLLFLVPLQYLWVKRGPNSFFVSAAVAVAGILGAKIVQAVGLSGSQVDYVLLFADLLLPAAFVVGLYVMNAPLPWKLRRVYRLFLGVAVGFVVTLPLIWYMAAQEVLTAALRQQLQVLDSVLAESSGTGTPLFGSRDAQEVVIRLAMDVFYGTYLAGFAMILSLNWYLGCRISRRFADSVPDVGRVRMPESLVWPFVLALGLTLLTVVADLGVLKYPIWNAALVLGFLYGIQGFAVSRHLLDRLGISRGLQLLIAVFAVMMLFVPAGNLVVVIGLPGLGVSEHWISYNRRVE